TRATSAVLTVGSLLSAGCFLVAIVLEIAGRSTNGGDVLDIGAVFRSMTVPEPWGWATAGLAVVIVTPAVSLVATAVEYRGCREAWLALGVLGILAASLGIALLR
ncbi:MAG: hypothetical protein M3395_08040, partial [Chloroflexota bacterium]|nr:hypothetical protein [Chloroflexota bacterium]